MFRAEKLAELYVAAARDLHRVNHRVNHRETGEKERGRRSEREEVDKSKSPDSLSRATRPPSYFQSYYTGDGIL